MFGNVLVGLKAGGSGGHLLELARKSAESGARLHLVTLIRASTSEEVPALVAEAEQELETHCRVLRDEGYDITQQVGVIAAAAGVELARIASERNADLIVIGLAKRSRVGKALMGSDAQRVLLSAHCPVLVERLAE
jgi:nucleotide-binding universal stress UspA family protein